MRKILVPIITIVLASVILLGLYNGLALDRQVNEAHDLQEKMEAMLPGSKIFTPEPYTGEDTNIHRVWKGETGYIVRPLPMAMRAISACWWVCVTRVMSPACRSGI